MPAETPPSAHLPVFTSVQLQRTVSCTCRLHSSVRLHGFQFDDEKRLMSYHQQLEDVVEDQVASLISQRLSPN